MPDTREVSENVSGSGIRQTKDDNSVNREIATLLLNLASRTTNNTNNEPEAMDLSKYSRARNNNSSVTSTTTTSSTASQQQFTSPETSVHNNPYSTLAPQSGVLTNPSLAANIGSSYLLQNLLIGQIQNLTGSTAGQASSALVQQSCQKSVSTPLDTTPPHSEPRSNITTAVVNNTLPLSNLGTSTIPLLSGHIVAQLNNLLFSVHGLSDKNIELNVQTQLSAIYSRLQEIVAMVNMSKKKDSTKSEPVSLVTSSSVKEETKFESKTVTDEQKITRQLEEYQRALYKSNKKTESVGQNYFTAGGQTSSEPLKLEINAIRSNDTAHSQSPESAEVSSVLENLRRRSSRDSYHQESPPEKRLRASSGHNTVLTPGSGSDSPQPTSSGRNKSGGKGGKGIRNRVFCGDCAGCLKNDDCGQCRYCRDKTKFGGQNRLRQKCLHRRCQMDTHRRSNTSGAARSGASPESSSSAGLTGVSGVSGVDLALYSDTDHLRPQHNIFSSLLGSSLRGEKTTSPETENSSGDMSQSRSDKWKAKHEAMLKLQQSISSSPDHSEETEKHVFENRNLVITIKDALKENTENQSIKEADVDERASERSRTNKSKTSESKKDVSRLTTRSMKPVFAL